MDFFGVFGGLLLRLEQVLVGVNTRLRFTMSVYASSDGYESMANTRPLVLKR